MDAKLNNSEVLNKISVESSFRIFDNPEFGSIRTVIINGEPWFVGKDMADILGYKHTVSALQDNVDEDDKRVVKLSDIQNSLPDHMKGSKITIINKRGLSDLLLRSERLSKKDKKRLIKSFNLNLNLYSRKEIEFKECLIDFFNALGFVVESQYRVGKYRLDFYIPALNLAIEYDENGHRDYDEDKESCREDFIKGRIGCSFIRVSDNKPNSGNLAIIIKRAGLLAI